MFGRIWIRMLGIVAAGMLTAGCETVGGWFSDDETPIEERSAREIFDAATAQLEDGDAEAAAKTFDEVERLYPFSQLAKRATIMSAFASYEA